MCMYVCMYVLSCFVCMIVVHRLILLYCTSHTMRAGLCGQDVPAVAFPSAVAMASFYVVSEW